MRRSLLVLVAVWLVAGSVSAQTASPPPSPAEQAALILAMRERIDKLEKRLAELEAKQEAASGAVLASAAATPALASAAPTPSVPAAPPAPAHQQGRHEDTAPPQGAVATYPSLKITGFADVDFSATDRKGATSGFNLGQLTLHMASPLSGKVSYFGEITFNASSTGFSPEVERSIIRYDHNDHFKISFGRYHTPINYWNTAFHHGLWLQTTISRPEMTQFGGRFIPVHFIGFLAEGSIPSSGAGLNYNVGVGNGRGATISRGGDAGDINNNRAWLVNIFSRPTKPYGLQLGASVYSDMITQASGPAIREWISSAHLVWEKENPEFLTEVANVHHRDTLTGRTFNSQAFYAQVAYRLPKPAEKWKPYYRFEYIHSPAGEPVLNVPNMVGSTLGIRYDISDFASFKSEYRNTKRQVTLPRVNGLFLQTSFTF
jgi:hypothetical protein